MPRVTQVGIGKSYLERCLLILDLLGINSTGADTAMLVDNILRICKCDISNRLSVEYRLVPSVSN